MKPPMRPPTPPPSQKSVTKIQFASVARSKGQRALLYGPGGIGKTTLACQLPGKNAMLDIEDSLPVLRTQLEEAGVELPVIIPATDWASTLVALQSDGWEGIDNIIIDSGTRSEEWATAHTMKTVPHEKGHYVRSIEGYGFGKGYRHVFETWLGMLNALDRHARAGRNVIIIAHDVVSNVPNPNGADWIRYEPRLQHPKSGEGSIRLKVREWCDHVLFLGYDVVVSEDKKAKGSGTRTLYTSELPHCMAKSRTTTEAFPIATGDSSVWGKIIK